ncbi:MAG TPA: GNAT family N-acetyltransferase [Pyrinomonadaceae bacterium]|nr:GNAT family N-acetyltransferase [Pyrinomonadaceae bacterium]
MQIENAASEDLNIILSLYDKAIEFQKTVFDKPWLGFDVEFVNKEIEEGRLWKIIDAGQIANIFSVTYSDPILWLEKSSDPAMYIHRIVTNPDFRGRGYVPAITEWAIRHAREKGLQYVRMDTWNDNQKLLDYYQNCGFKFVGTVEPEESDTLPPHYRGLRLALLEIGLDHDSTTI